MLSQSIHLLSLPELLSAKNKLGEVASFNDVRKYDFSGFKYKEALEPYAFRQELQIAFGVILSDAELGSLVTLFDKDGDGKVSVTEFMKDFFKLGKDRRETKVIKSGNKRRIQNAKVKKQKDDLLKTIIPSSTVSLPESWTKEHEISATKKILQAALSYTGKRYLIEVL
jgi:hypothetical protein